MSDAFDKARLSIMSEPMPDACKLSMLAAIDFMEAQIVEMARALDEVRAALSRKVDRAELDGLVDGLRAEYQRHLEALRDRIAELESQRDALAMHLAMMTVANDTVVQL